METKDALSLLNLPRDSRACVLANFLNPPQVAREVKLYEIATHTMDNKGFESEDQQRREKIKRMFSWTDGLPPR